MMTKLKPWLLGQFKKSLPLRAFRYKKRKYEQQQVPPSSFEGSTPFALGILSEFSQYHLNFVEACRELNISYKVIDFTSDRWLRNVEESGCKAFLVWPSAFSIALRHLYDERLKVLVETGEKIIFPSYDELWLWESKRRMHDWLVAHRFSHPRTWVFYDIDQAEDFIATAEYPLLYKPDFGDCSQGLKLLRTRQEALRQVRKAFSYGISLPGSFLAERQWGSVVLQEFLAEAEEWRTAKIGRSFFGYVKVRVGTFASGSGRFRHSRPPDDLLDFAERICETGRFNSMSLDIFRMPDGRMLVNELQAVFGTSHARELCIVDGEPGRMLRQEGRWIFEAGSYCRNQMCNLRVEALLQELREIDTVKAG